MGRWVVMALLGLCCVWALPATAVHLTVHRLPLHIDDSDADQADRRWSRSQRSIDEASASVCALWLRAPAT